MSASGAWRLAFLEGGCFTSLVSKLAAETKLPRQGMLYSEIIF
jgi:hypothetical protein